MNHSVEVRAPARLHFGMFSFGHRDRPQFGGVGVMVEPPGVQVTIRLAEQFTAEGMLAERVEQFVATAVRHWRVPSVPPCRFSVGSPPDHVGLGVGTQLGLAVAAGLRRFLGLPKLPVEELAASAGRGMRSAVGTYGFRDGGLIVDAGKNPAVDQRPPADGGRRTAGDAHPTRLARRLALPDGWRFVLVRPAGARGLAGDHEANAFGRLPPVPEDITRELWRITDEEMLPAAKRADCPAFGEAVYRFGHLAGGCFAAVQGGPFASPEIARLVASIRDRGVAGAGQSSWGPTVFAIVADEAQAQSLTGWLRRDGRIAEADITISRPNNRGAHVSTFS